jgi:hypothetical protein
MNETWLTAHGFISLKDWGWWSRKAKDNIYIIVSANGVSIKFQHLEEELLNLGQISTERLEALWFAITGTQFAQ